jgi:hypothetical protein
MKYRFPAVVVLVVSMSIQITSAQPEKAGFVPFKQFLADTAAAVFSNRVHASGTGVADAESFARMRRYILDLYEGVQVSHSYVQDSQTFDCVPIEQQPSLRMRGRQGTATAPPQHSTPRSQPQAAARHDAFGNATTCEEHTIPMRRVTLEEITRFKNLDDFLGKAPDGGGRAPIPPAPGSR